MRDSNSWVPIFTGGLAGALLNQLASIGIVWCKRPVLQLIFHDKIPGCDVPTPTNNPSENHRYLRVRVNNRGCTTAHGVSLSVIKIKHSSKGSGTYSNQEEVLELRLSLTDKVTFDLAQGAHRFVDLFCIIDKNGDVSGDISFLTAPVRFRRNQFGPGDYQLTVLATANNTNSVEEILKWKWGGSIHDIEVLNTGFLEKAHRISIGIRFLTSLLALCLTAAFWVKVVEIISVSVIALGDYGDISKAPTLFEVRLRACVLMAVSMAVYGLGVHFWRRLDDWLKTRKAK